MAGTEIYRLPQPENAKKETSSGTQQGKKEKEEPYTPESFQRLSGILAAVEKGEALSLEAEDQSNPELMNAAATVAEKLIGGNRGQEYAAYFRALEEMIQNGEDPGNDAEAVLAQLGSEINKKLVEGSVSDRAIDIGQATFREQDIRDTAQEIQTALSSGRLVSLDQAREYLNDPLFVDLLNSSLPIEYTKMHTALQEKRTNPRFADLLEQALTEDRKRIERDRRSADVARVVEQVMNLPEHNVILEEMELDESLGDMEDSLSEFIADVKAGRKSEALNVCIDILTDVVSRAQQGKLSAGEIQLAMRVLERIYQHLDGIDKDELEDFPRQQIEYIEGVGSYMQAVQEHANNQQSGSFAAAA